MSRMWEVDPETRAKLLQISKTNGNDKCCDCGAPSPQWASPKFGTFICLNCAGTHRGLGVHISFVRSITMDAFKTAEIMRMEQGGNEPWKSFFDGHVITQSEGRTFEDSTIKERYEGEVGEEWKERLSAKIEGREYVPGQASQPSQQPKKQPQPELSSRSSTPLARGGSPASHDGLVDGGGGGAAAGATKKERNEAYFAKLGSANATRSESLPPSQGGKFTGFGGGMPPAASAGSGRAAGTGPLPGFDDFQKDPMAALTKGFGWFTTTVGKGAKTVNESYIQPTAKTIAESDFAAQARLQASQLGQNLQTGARGAAGHFHRFVEGQDEAAAAAAARRERGRTGAEPERKEFWDSFSGLGAQDSHRRNTSRSSAIGTAAMKPGSGVGATGVAGSTATTSASSAASGTGTGRKSLEDNSGWDDNW
ncbi:GTPase-activating protein GCS1 [Aspergillus homomorphus CBS 101889]|uniref:ArfGap-domain-containing protein n=1 Tax=Aspergillus homomorphus (strain CBS 101889) TaxID=1450537 RepID=A0A395I8E7_ASPHC|nr:ArfGap-domain-containing protein [Aspergillus homomorphus CBS 101889]RAL14424.1 ArfGap-domain-containing protein [Aspergillus homomorphus CBS 101889]